MKRHFGGRLPLQAKPDKESKVISGFLCRVLPAFGCRHNVLLPQASAVLAWCCWGLPRAPWAAQSQCGRCPRGHHQKGGVGGGTEVAPVPRGLCRRRLSMAGDCGTRGKQNEMLLSGRWRECPRLIETYAKDLCAFNERGQVLDLHSASN